MALELKIPDVGESIAEVEILKWLKKEGEKIEKDETIVELQTDKATMELPSPAAGIVKEIKHKDGDIVSVGDVIGLIDENGSASKSRESRGAKEQKKTETKEKAKTEEKQAQPEKVAKQKEPQKQQKQPKESKSSESQNQESNNSKVERVSPSVREKLRKYDVDISEIKGTGPHGRVVAEDVERYVEQRSKKSESKKAPSKSSEEGREEESVPMSPIRRHIASRLVKEQQEAALLTTFNEIDMFQIKELRKKYQESFQKKHQIKLGLMSFFVKATIEALKDFPKLNARIEGNNIIYHNYFDMGIAIGLEDKLVVPVLKNAERLSFAEIEKSIADFAKRAQDGKLKADEMQGGTFTLTNGGVFGSLLSTPIVNPPQSGILGMHTIQDRPVVRDGEIVIRPMMYVALSYDHRIVDGREAVLFLNTIKENLENPSRILLEL